MPLNDLIDRPADLPENKRVHEKLILSLYPNINWQNRQPSGERPECIGSAIPFPDVYRHSSLSSRAGLLIQVRAIFPSLINIEQINILSHQIFYQTQLLKPGA